MSPLAQPRASLPLASLMLVLLAVLQGCDTGSTLDSRRFPCEQDDECLPGFVCRVGVCQPEGDEPGEVPDGGRPDGGRPDGGGTDGGPDSGVPDSGVPDAGPVVRPTQLGFVTPPQTVNAGACSPGVQIETRTADGTAAPVAAPTTVALRARNNDLLFYTAQNCLNPRTQVNVGAGSSRATFYFRGNAAGVSPIDVSATGLTGATQNATIRPGPPASVVFIGDSQVVSSGACSEAVVLEARDTFGNPASFSAPTAAGVAVQPAGGLSLFSDAACTTAITDATFAAGATQALFYFKGKTGGSFILSGGPTGFARVNQAATILPVVRSGTCLLAVGALSVSCPISPPQRDVTKTMLMYQASSDSGDPHTSSVRCTLTNTSTVTCTRLGSAAEASISWQTAELASGLKVQHLQATCTNQLSVDVPTQPIGNLGNTFVLVSSQSDGTAVAADDFFTAWFHATDHLDINFGTSCATAWRASIQVVEMTGATVTRGITGPMASAATELVVANLPPADPATTALLFTYRVSTANAPGICDRALRGALTSPTSITFTRSDGDVGCEDAVIDAISWERINLGARGQAQHLDAFMDDLETSTQVPIPVAVDPTRTLVFSGNQALSGQAMAETDFEDDDNLGAVCGHHILASPTRLDIYRNFSSDADARWYSTVLQLEP
jgi:hypothetical protein